MIIYFFDLFYPLISLFICVMFYTSINYKTKLRKNKLIKYNYELILIQRIFSPTQINFIIMLCQKQNFIYTEDTL